MSIGRATGQRMLWLHMHFIAHLISVIGYNRQLRFYLFYMVTWMVYGFTFGWHVPSLLVLILMVYQGNQDLVDLDGILPDPDAFSFLIRSSLGVLFFFSLNGLNPETSLIISSPGTSMPSFLS
ncbi:hypothetical protein J1N35_045285 [Gossypium stocksii]|uniref:Uncharacterized protein n=1 Tax=Gossypium stocksii TaxID=47602 RepID=A0A9D3ZGU8_9ROSI|nr:hypothetical protein J1N35_045285 [Gossypium stocksii]